MTPEQLLAGIQEEVRGLSENGPATILRKRDAEESVDSTVAAVWTVTMASEVARLNRLTSCKRYQQTQE